MLFLPEVFNGHSPGKYKGKEKTAPKITILPDLQEAA